MENNFLEQICFDLQLDDQMLDEISQMYVQSSGVQSPNHNYNDGTNNSLLINKCAEVIEIIDSSRNSSKGYFIDIEKSKIKINAKIDDYCMKIIRDMNSVGVSLIDHFMEELGEYILQEVIYLYQTVS